MMPVAPTLLVRPLQAEEETILAEALNEALATAPYSAPLSTETVQAQLYSAAPPTLMGVRWQHHQCLCAWRARRLEGFVDIGAGFDSESLDVPEYRPLGLLRFMLVRAGETSTEVADALLRAAEHFWRGVGVSHIKAFHASTGYPTFQAGFGALPGDWPDLMRALTNAGYQLTERFYCLSRTLGEMVEEVTPLADLSLVYGGAEQDRIYHLYRRTEWIGAARLVAFPLERAGASLRLAKLLYIEIDTAWQGMNIGKWLVKRLINDCTLQRYDQLLVHVPSSRPVASILFNQLGFVEQNYRGYTLEKTLTR